ncbi:hypothetical protein BC354_13350 [Vibrio cholerae]|nr:hypothetical protein [Vibrio cholerae]RGP86578.1 hypothetical protein BC354_13350 [Vibrio cholerae]RGP94342.1 hypothetical protein BC352_13005 [Vibrio cholerae]
MRLSHKRKVRSKKGIDQAAWEAKQKRRFRRVRPVVWIVPNRIGKTSKFWSARQEMARLVVNTDAAARMITNNLEGKPISLCQLFHCEEGMDRAAKQRMLNAARDMFWNSFVETATKKADEIMLAEPRRERYVPSPITKAALDQRFEIYHRASPVDSPSIEELAKDKTPSITEILVNGFKRLFGVSA